MIAEVIWPSESPNPKGQFGFFVKRTDTLGSSLSASQKRSISHRKAKRRAGATFQTGDVAEGEINVLANYSKLQ